MQLEVNSLFHEIGATETFESLVTLDYDDSEIRMGFPLDVCVKAMNVGQTILVSGDIMGHIEVQCGCCLEFYSFPVDIEIEEEFFKSAADCEISETPVTDENLVNDDGMIELDDIIRQNVLASVPYNPKCRPDCPGILYSPRQALIDNETVDPRLIKLKEWREKQ